MVSFCGPMCGAVLTLMLWFVCATFLSSGFLVLACLQFEHLAKQVYLF